MSWFKRLFSSKPDESPAAASVDTEEDKNQRASALSADERKAFEWFKQGYTARWTAETMLLNRKTAKRVFGSVFRKLGVVDEAEVCRFYRTTPLRPEDIPPEEDSF